MVVDNKNIFDEAVERERIEKTPIVHTFCGFQKIKSYNTSLYPTFVHLNFKYFKEMTLVNDSVLINFEDEPVQVYFYQNITKIKKIVCEHKKTRYEYFLKKGKLHNENDYAYRVIDKKGKICGKYFLYGRYLADKEWKIYSRILKLKRVFKNN